MTTKLETAARQALEALEYVLKPKADFDETVCQKLHDTAIAALREALAEQAAPPNAIMVEGFSGVAMRKLNDLQGKGYAINGVSIATYSATGETQRGAVTTGGMVLWWPQPQAAEPVDSERIAALRTLSYCDGVQSGWNFCADGNEAALARALSATSEAMRLLKTHPAPNQQPLTADDEPAATDRGAS
jgi:hypothetical protein